MSTPQELAELRKCEAEDCEYKVLNAITDVTQIIGILNNHILAAHPVVQKSTAGGSEIIKCDFARIGRRYF